MSTGVFRHAPPIQRRRRWIPSKTPAPPSGEITWVATHDTNTRGDASSTSASITSASVTPNAVDNFIVVAAMFSGGPLGGALNLTISDTLDVGTWSEESFEGVIFGGYRATWSVFIAKVTGTTAGTVTVTGDQGTGLEQSLAICVMEFSGLDETDPMIQSKGSIAEAASVATTFDAALTTDSAVIACLYSTGSDPQPTFPTGYSIGQDENSIIGIDRASVAYDVTPASTTVTWTGLSSGDTVSDAAFAVELRPAAAPTVVFPDVRVGGVWVTPTAVKVRVAGAWVDATAIKVRSAGSWVDLQ